MRKILPCTIAALLLTGVVAVMAEDAEPQKESPKIYIIPDEVKCYMRKEDRITFCTDLAGNPITGELRKYREGELIRQYPLTQGILDGTVISYYINGDILSEKPYEKGKLNGIAKTYYKHNKLESTTPYKKGYKEGVAKFYYENGYMQEQGIYIGGKLNGQYRLYDKTGEMVYELTFQNNALISGYCMYKKSETDTKRYKQNLDEKTLSMLKKHQIFLETTIEVNGCAMGKGRVNVIQ